MYTLCPLLSRHNVRDAITIDATDAVGPVQYSIQFVRSCTQDVFFLFELQRSRDKFCLTRPDAQTRRRVTGSGKMADPATDNHSAISNHSNHSNHSEEKEHNNNNGTVYFR